MHFLLWQQRTEFGHLNAGAVSFQWTPPLAPSWQHPAQTGTDEAGICAADLW